MTLRVRTARLSRALPPDALNITRATGTIGLPFAPSWAILRPALATRRRVAAMRADGDLTGVDPGGPSLIEADAWQRYVPAYTAEMRRSYREQRAAWDALLGRERVVLACMCVDPEHCHRRLLAGILVKLGAVDEGEQP